MIYEGTFLDERSEKQRALDAWLPVTNSTNGNWWNTTGYRPLYQCHGWSRRFQSSFCHDKSWMGCWCWWLAEKGLYNACIRHDGNFLSEALGIPAWSCPPIDFMQYLCRACSMFGDIMFPHFGSLIGFLGGFPLASCLYILPCIMWFSIFKPKKLTSSWTVNWEFFTKCLEVGNQKDLDIDNDALAKWFGKEKRWQTRCIGSCISRTIVLFSTYM